MLKNVDQPIQDLSGRPVLESDALVTIKGVCVNALLTSNEGGPSGDQKAARYQLALRLCVGGEVDLSPEDLVLVKQVVGATYLPLVVGQVFAWCGK